MKNIDNILEISRELYRLEQETKNKTNELNKFIREITDSKDMTNIIIECSSELVKIESKLELAEKHLILDLVGNYKFSKTNLLHRLKTYLEVNK